MNTPQNTPKDIENDPGLLFRRSWGFVRGVVALSGLPDSDRNEIAFAGRSNVGKSSLINALVRQKGLARTSSTPGRTQEINYFEPDEGGDPCYLVDLPGYGYAKAPKDHVAAWTGLVKDYLRGRPNLRRVFLLIDARHGLKANDLEIIKMLDEAAVSYQAVLTKMDKLKPPGREKAIKALSDALKTHPAAYPVILGTSSEKNWGMDDLARTAAIALLGLEHIIDDAPMMENGD